jgi:LPS-assembly lipoprotein
MATNKWLAAIFLVGAALALGGCGFTPLYATAPGESGAVGLRNVALASVSAPESVAPVVSHAFEKRTSDQPSTAAYDLLVDASEQAERLAVQIDASVTRYNYRLVGKYTLIERGSGKRLSGRITSFASFNVVNSQYSTLFAENAAKEKAADQLAEDIERDILMQLADAKDRK